MTSLSAYFHAVTIRADASTLSTRGVRVTGEMVRYLAPAKVGPVRAVPRVLAVDDRSALVEVQVIDEGADARVVAVGSVSTTAT